MRILALDTSTGPASVAIIGNGKTVATYEDNEPMRQSQRLVSATDALVRANGGYETLDAMAVTTGPGGFTGIRVALAAARGLALASGVPLLGISTLETFAWQALYNQPEGKQAIAYVNAYRNQAYVQPFIRSKHGMEPIREAEAVDFEDAAIFAAPYANTLHLGNIDGSTLRLVDYTVHTAPQAVYTASYAAQLLANGQTERPAEAFYIRPPDAKPQKPLLGA